MRLPESQNPPPVIDVASGQTLSPSPEPGQPAPTRRRADKPGAFKVQWAALWSALTLWSVSFLNEIAKMPWERLKSREFIFEHAAQIVSVIAAVIFAKSIKS